MKRGSLQIKFPLKYYLGNIEVFLDHVNQNKIILEPVKMKTKGVITEIRHMNRFIEGDQEIFIPLHLCVHWQIVIKFPGGAIAAENVFRDSFLDTLSFGVYKIVYVK